MVNEPDRPSLLGSIGFVAEREDSLDDLGAGELDLDILLVSSIVESPVLWEEVRDIS